MTRSRPKVDSRTKKGRELARQIYDRKIRDLETMSLEDKARLRKEYPPLSQAEVDDVIRQVIEAKHYEQQQIGWRAIPHDISVLILVVVTVAFNLQAGVIACIASLVLLESLAQFYFNQKIYKPLSTLVWLTYPAYALFGYVLYKRDGLEILWVVAAVLLAWLGTFLFGSIARLPIRLILESSQKGKQAAAQRKQSKVDKGPTRKQKVKKGKF